MTPDELKALRQRLGLTQTQMAERLAYRRRHYQRLESGESPINQRTAMLCDALAQQHGGTRNA